MTASISTKALRGKSSLEKKFLLLWASLGGRKLEEEVVFAPPRKWRFDFCAANYVIEATGNPPDSRNKQGRIRIMPILAIELEGGIWLKKSGHNTGTGISRDIEKYNTAQLLGWKVFRLTSDMITARHVQPIVDLCK